MGPTQNEPYRAAVDWVDADVLVDLVGRWDRLTIARARSWAREELAALPAPMHPYAGSPLIRRRSRLEILLGVIESRAVGDDRRLVEAARREWVHGASHVAYLRLLIRLGRREHAAALALSILEDRTEGVDEVRALLDRTLRLPPGTEAHILALVDEPTVERWLEVVRFWPMDERELRVRYLIVRLLRARVEADSIFRLAATEGPIVPLVDLVERGIVDPAVISAYASELAISSRAIFAGLAARAAAARGESFLAARHLRDARSLGLAASKLQRDIDYVRAHGDASLASALRASGFSMTSPFES